MVNNLLCVIEQEATKQHQSAIHVDGMETREQCTPRSSKHTSYMHGRQIPFSEKFLMVLILQFLLIRVKPQNFNLKFFNEPTYTTYQYLASAASASCQSLKIETRKTSKSHI